MSTQWKSTKERSTSLVLKLARWGALTLGRPFLRISLFPICFYYLLFTPKSKKNTKAFLQKVLQRKVTWRDHFKHYHSFASVILDRVYFLTEKNKYFNISVNGEEKISNALKQKQGVILLGSHLGSFEVLRSLAGKNKISLKVLMHLETSLQMTRLLHELNPKTEQSIIAMGKPESLLQVKESLAQNGVIGILADRVYQDKKVVEQDFLHQRTLFATGPFRLIELFKVPVIFFCGLYEGGNRYQIHFEEIDIANTDKPEDILAKYLDKLETHTRQSPYNWFNFYDYWKTY